MQFQQSDMQQYALGLPLSMVRRDGCLFDKGYTPMPSSRRRTPAVKEESSSDSSTEEIEENDCIGGRFYVGKLLGSVRNVYCYVLLLPAS